jgi:hypothetical protein
MRRKIITIKNKVVHKPKAWFRNIKPQINIKWKLKI